VVVTVPLLAILRLAGHLTDPRLTDVEIHRITGEPDRIGVPSAPRRQLTVVTWNIDRGRHFDRIAGRLHALGADIVLLQEADRFCRRSGARDVARDLADALGMNWVAAGEFQEIGEARGGVPAITGQAILSRQPITDPAVIVFRDQTPFRWRFNPVQPRRGGRIALKARTAGALVYNVHIESGGDDALRRSQVDEVLADAAHEQGGPVVIAGDFNNSAAARPSLLTAMAIATFTDALGNSSGQPTSIRHRHPIDGIFVRGGDTAGGHVERVENASDHHLLRATLSDRK